ncbi:MAG: hypothetical protein IPM69_00145 [Ignavibacteria bacterium]|nr:hypothetical protein [Ignavibacteria bacterium]
MNFKQLKLSILRILLVACLLQIFLSVGNIYAQFSAETFKLQKASEHYDERGFMKGKSLSVDGNLVVNNSNGILSYSYPVSSFNLHSYPMNVSLNYCGSVGFTAFQAYENTHRFNCNRGWSKIAQNKPLWIIGLNGFAVQTISQNTAPMTSPQEIYQYFIHKSSGVKFEPKVWLVNGYDFCNRMKSLKNEDCNYIFLDIIRLLRSDGSVLELCNRHDSTPPDLDKDPRFYSGLYFEKGTNTKGYAYVELQDTRPPSLQGLEIGDMAVLSPRIVHYFPGDGLEYVFREDVAPYGSQFYSATNPWTGGLLAAPTIFYLDEVRSEKRSLLTLHYSDPELQVVKGRRQLTDFFGHKFSFGGYRGRIEAFGKTTELYFDTLLRSPNHNTSINPILTSSWEASSLPMIKRIVDPAGRQVSFDYGIRKRIFTNYKWPIEYHYADCDNNSNDQIAVSNTKRLIKYNEPASFTEILYHGDTSGTVTIQEGNYSGATSSDNPYSLSEVAKEMVTKEYNGTKLLTKEFAYSNSAPSATAAEWATWNSIKDERTNKKTYSTFGYKRHLYSGIFEFIPGLGFTDLLVSTEGSDSLRVATYTAYSFMSNEGDSLNLRLPVSRKIIEYINGDTSTKITKAYSTFEYVIDTVVRFTTETAKKHYGFGVIRQYENIFRPDSTTSLLYRKLTDWQVFPDSLQTFYIQYGWDKIASLKLYYALKKSDVNFTKSWEECLEDGDTRVIVSTNNGKRDTIFSYLPAAYLEKASFITDGDEVGYPATKGKIIQGVSKKFSSISAYNFTSILDRVMVVADTTFGLGGTYTVSSKTNFGDNAYLPEIQMPSEIMNSNGSVTRYRYRFQDVPDSWQCSINSSHTPEGKIRRNDDTDSIGLFSSSENLYWWHEPLSESKVIRKFLPSHSGIDTTFLPTMYERTYYGLHKGVIDPNGWYTAAKYDEIGRLLKLSYPYDFNSSAHLIEQDRTVQTIREPGYTIMERKSTWRKKFCNQNPPDTSWHYQTFIDSTYFYSGIHSEKLYSNYNGGLESSPKKGEQTLTTPCDWQNQTSIRDSVYYGVIPFQVYNQNIVTLDSVVLEIAPEKIDPCFTLVIKILKRNGSSAPTTYSGGNYYFNCDSAFSDTSQETISDTGYVNPDRHKLKFKLPAAIVNSIMTASSGIAFFDVNLYASSSYKAGTFAQTGDDVMPQIKLYGVFKNDVDLTDYSLKYTYEDYYGSSATWVRAKIDDTLHTSNKMATLGTASDNKRISIVANTFRGDGALTSSSLYHGEPTNSSTIKSTVTFLNNGVGKPIETADQLGYISRVNYDEFGRVIRSNNPDSISETGDSNTFVTRLYDVGSPSKFNLQRVINDPDYQDFYGYVSMQSVTNENGRIFTQYSDALGRMRREIADSGAALGNFTTLYDYDIVGRLTRVVNPEGQKTEYWYDDYGRVKYKRQPDLGILSYAYDKVGNVRFTQTSEQDSLSKLTFHEYDDLNRITVVGEARLTNTPHDTLPNLNRLTDVLDPNVLHDNGQSGILTANKTMWNDSSTYSTPSIPTNASQSDCLPNVTYDSESYTYTGSTFMMNIGTEVSDALPLTGVTNFENIGKNPANIRMVIHYDTLPSRTGVIWGNFTPSTLTDVWNDLSPTGAVRNMKGHEVAVAYREKVNEPFHYVVMSYDERGRVEALLRFTGNIGFDAVYYKYNSANQVIRLITADGMRQHGTWYGYDGNGRMDSVWTKLGGSGTGLGLTDPVYPSVLVKPSSPEIVYRYDKRGLVDSTLLIEPQVVERYHYGARKWLDSMKASQGDSILFSQKLEFDKVGNIEKQITKQKDALELAVSYEYDNINRIKLWNKDYGNFIFGDAYFYDKVGNRISKRLYDHDGLPYPYDTTAYTYGNGNNQLTQVKYGIKPETNNYWYNKDGALRLREKEVKIATSMYSLQRDVFGYVYNGLLKTFGTSSWNGSSITCMRDSLSAPQWQWQYRYSAGGERESKRMVVAPLDDHSAISHLWTYYLLGGNKQQFAVYNGRETSEGDACYNTTHRVHFYPVEYLTYGNGASALITTRPNDFREYKIVDHLGSTRVVLDSNGAILSTYDFEPFGKPLAMTGLDSRKSFIDREKDGESGLGNFGVRSFDDDLGIFTSIDPMWENYRAYSPYNYCGNNPVRLSDPDGKAWPIGAIALVVAEVALTVTDVVDAYSTIMDPNASGLDKTISGVGLVLGLALPGGGYGIAGKGVAKVISKVDDAVEAGNAMQKLKKSAETGQEAHRQIQKKLKDIDPNVKTEQNVVLKDRTVRKDFVRPDGTKGIIKPDTPSGQKSAASRERLMQRNGHKTETIFYNPKDPAYQPGSSTYIGPKK